MDANRKNGYSPNGTIFPLKPSSVARKDGKFESFGKAEAR